MVKPVYGYNMEKYENQVQFPEGWETQERVEQLKKRRAFFDVELHDWIVKHDIHGDRSILKTIFQRGEGYDRAVNFDEVTLDIAISTSDQLK